MILGCELVPVNVKGWIDWHGGEEAVSLLVGVALRTNMSTSSQLSSPASERLVITVTVVVAVIQSTTTE